MTREPIFQLGEREAAIGLVHQVFTCAAAEDISNQVALDCLRLLFAGRFPHLGERHMIEAMRGALVLH
jgi:hypothetical protein